MPLLQRAQGPAWAVHQVRAAPWAGAGPLSLLAGMLAHAQRPRRGSPSSVGGTHILLPAPR